MKKPILFVMTLLFLMNIVNAQTISNPYSLTEAIVIFTDDATNSEIETFLDETGMEVKEGPTPILNCYLLEFKDTLLPYQYTNPQDTINGVVETAQTNTKIKAVGLNFGVVSPNHQGPGNGSHGEYCYSLFSEQLNGGNPIATSIFDTGITRKKSIRQHHFLPKDVGYNFVGPGSPWDRNNHGTHVSSIIMENLENVNDMITLYAYKTQNDRGIGDIFNAIQAIDKAIEEGINIVNMSFSFSAPMQHGVEPKSILSKVMEEAEILGGILFIAAAGNESEDNDFTNNLVGDVAFPASYINENIIAVASADCNMQISWFSNYGTESVDVFAPGENIWGYNKQGEDLKLSGTSQATAFVTKLATYLGTHQSVFEWKAVKCAILSGVEPSPSVGYVLTDGYVNVDNSLNLLLSDNCSSSNQGRVEATGTTIDLAVFIDGESSKYEINSCINQSCNLQVVDISGRIISSQKLDLLEGTHEYNIKDLSISKTGIYFVNIQGQNFNKTFKIFK